MARRITELVLALLAAVGGFFVVLQLGWIAGLDEATWFPYLAQPVAVLLASLAMAKTSSTYSAPRAFVVGAASVGALALIARLAPAVFVLTAARSSNAVFALPLLSLLCGLGAGVGALIVPRSDHRPSLFWAAVVVAFAASDAIQLGGRVLQTLDHTTTENDILIANSIFTFLIGAAVQTVVPRRAIEAAAAGVAGLMAIVVFALVKRHVNFDSTSLARTVVPVVITSAVGAALIWWRSPYRA